MGILVFPFIATVPWYCNMCLGKKIMYEWSHLVQTFVVQLLCVRISVLMEENKEVTEHH